MGGWFSGYPETLSYSSKLAFLYIRILIVMMLRLKKEILHSIKVFSICFERDETLLFWKVA